MSTPKEKQSEIVREARALVDAVREYDSDLDSARGGNCILETAALMSVQARRGVSMQFQAGTCLWPVIYEDEDDGKLPTHFGYEWSPHSPQSRRAREIGMLPEVHVWCVNGPDEKVREIVDISTHDIPRIADLTLGAQFSKGLTPPPFLWTPVHALPPRTVYHANEEAMAFIWPLLKPVLLDMLALLRTTGQLGV